MDEWSQTWVFPLRILAILIFTWLYVIGGRRYKFIRRFVGSTLFAAACCGLAYLDGLFSYYLPLAFIPLVLGLTMGYGADDLDDSFFRRGLYGLVIGFAGLFVGVLTGNIELGVIQLFLATIASVTFGVFNPFHTAVKEEGAIALFVVVLIPFMC